MDPLAVIQFYFIQIPVWTMPFAQMGGAANHMLSACLTDREPVASDRRSLGLVNASILAHADYFAIGTAMLRTPIVSERLAPA